MFVPTGQPKSSMVGAIPCGRLVWWSPGLVVAWSGGRLVWWSPGLVVAWSGVSKKRFGNAQCVIMLL